MQSRPGTAFTSSSFAMVSLAVATIILKLPTLDTPAYWDEMGWLRGAHWLLQNSLHNAIPGLHPPGLHLILATLGKVFGVSPNTAHALIAVFAALGVCATFLLVRYWYGTRRNSETSLRYLDLVAMHKAAADRREALPWRDTQRTPSTPLLQLERFLRLSARDYMIVEVLTAVPLEVCGSRNRGNVPLRSQCNPPSALHSKAVTTSSASLARAAWQLSISPTM